MILRAMSNAWKLEHNSEQVHEILNRIMQGIVSIITSALMGSARRKQFELTNSIIVIKL